MIEEYVCPTCRFRTQSKYYETGMIAHENDTIDQNVRITYEREGINGLIEDLQNPDNPLRFKEAIWTHRRMWLEANHRERLQEFDTAIAAYKEMLQTAYHGEAI